MAVAALACDAVAIAEAAPNSDIPIRIAIMIFLTDMMLASL